MHQSDNRSLNGRRIFESFTKVWVFVVATFIPVGNIRRNPRQDVALESVGWSTTPWPDTAAAVVV